MDVVVGEGEVQTRENPAARQQPDERWRTAFENSAIGIMMADFSGRFFGANTAFLNLLGYTESELYQLTLTDITCEEDHQENVELVRELTLGLRQHFEMEKRYRRKDCTLVWVRTNVALVPGVGAVEPFWFGVVEDITELKRAQEQYLLLKDELTVELGAMARLHEFSTRLLGIKEFTPLLGDGNVVDRHDWKHAPQALRATQAELARVSRVTTMGELAASIAHEVNQPLTAVVNNASACLRLLADRNLDPAVLGRVLEEIVADGARASAVIARIRAFIKKAPTERHELDVNDVIQEVLALTSHELHENRVLLECQMLKPLPPVCGDRVQLQQVLLNLIVNAIEAMTVVTDRPRLLKLQTQIDESRRVLVKVCDSGTGLDRGADLVFNPFFTTKPSGMGLGLSISRSLIEGHGGQLWAASNHPHGAVLSFALPIAEGL